MILVITKDRFLKSRSITMEQIMVFLENCAKTKLFFNKKFFTSGGIRHFGDRV